MTITKAVIIRTKKLLKEKNMTQYRLEQDSGILHGHMDGILHGKSKTVTLTTIYRLARGFNMTIYEFLDDDVFKSDELELD